jgi:Icc-related predicted phosphoesterase
MGHQVKILAVTDLHQLERLYQLLGDAITFQRPDVLALVGDFLDCLGSVEPYLSAEQCANFIAGLEVPQIVFVRGNHEDSNWSNFLIAWTQTGRKLMKLHGESAVFGPAVVTGFPCLLGDEFSFASDKEPLPAEHESWVARLLRQHGPAMRTLWLMHEPPASGSVKSSDSPLACNRIWTDLIERFSPLLTISGHDHATPVRTGRWFRRFGATVCVNVGQTESGPLHYTLIEAEFATDIPCLPTRMRVTAYPDGEALEVVGNGK